ncbi:hypothetical protein Droror1_Dr00002137 [Drosera rotundifolia]
MASSNRPLLIPSPKTPSSIDFTSIPTLAELMKSGSHGGGGGGMAAPSVSGMDSNNHPVDGSVHTESTARSSSRRSAGSYHSRGLAAHSSVRDVNFGDLGSRIQRHESRRAPEFEGYGTSQKEIDDDDARWIYINDPVKTNQKYEFTGNSIRTSKYSFISFIPRNLFEQFHRIAYIYFLVIAILNQLPQLAVFGRGASILPLAIVLFVSAIKDAYEDLRRHRGDRIENNRLALVLVNGKFQEKKWKYIQVGEIIKVPSNQSLPCDIALLSTSDPTGVAYVQTINLDGESNLKTRYAKQETLMKNPEKENISGIIKCEKPNRNIYGFQANMEIDGKKMSLGPSNIILRGCELKNTEWAIGVAVYAGQETKAMLNSSGAPSKRSRLETQMNREIILLSLFLIALCTVVSALFGVWLVNHKDQLNDLPYYLKENYGVGLAIFFTFLMAVIVFQIMIPISLYISMELVRVGQAYFMVEDGQMYDEASHARFQCRALNINEDLGQIKYVFSDKTGTLTENKMEFECASIYGVDYSTGISRKLSDQASYSVRVDDQIFRPKMKVKVDTELEVLAKGGTGTNEGEQIHNFFLALAACNTIVPIVTDTDDPTVKLIDYQGESPDEQALVYSAAAYGFMLIERTSGHIVIDVQGEKQRFDVLGLHEFDSDRKRMSVILGLPDKTVKVFVKGADTTMFGVINSSLNPDVITATKAHLHKYSSIGLRTLVIGVRELNGPEFERWQSSYEAASTSLMGRAAKLRHVASNIEKNIQILGASGIEDKLQEGVPEAIESLRVAGIKVWVLTGDKQETAISIGYSSKLLTNEMKQIVINGSSKDMCRRRLQEALTMARNRKAMTGGAPNNDETSGDDLSLLALIIDGTSLVYILDSELEKELFLLACECTVVLCCRVAPLQKAGVVSLIKRKTDDMTLAIGDGANDVSMIQVADVGVGISGQEGRQAVMASDFAAGQFRFVVPLLLVHGHWNYQRMGNMILYNFYRNAVWVLLLFWYTLYTAYTLTTAVTEWSSVLYSVIYTSIPTIVVGILDKDLSRRTLLSYPQLYGAGQREECYNSKLFWVTMVDTVWQSAVVFFIPLAAYWKTTVDASALGDLWTLAAVVMVNLHLAMDVIRWNWIMHTAIWGSIVATFICVIAIDAIPVLPGYWAVFHAMGNSAFWLCMIGVPVVGMIPRFVVKYVSQYYCPSDIQIAREAEKYNEDGSWIREGSVVEMSRISSPLLAR